MSTALALPTPTAPATRLVFARFSVISDNPARFAGGKKVKNVNSSKT
jgi:hypothetical protein